MPRCSSLGNRLNRVLGSRIIRNAASLYATTILTSAFGFFFWLIAARTMPADSVGTANALLSAAQLCAAFLLFGLGTLTISELGVRTNQAKQIILTNAIVASAAAAIGSAVVVAVLIAVPSQLQEQLRSPPIAILLVVLTAVTGALLVVDDGCIGLGRGRIQFQRNAVFAALKLALLPVGASVLFVEAGLPVLASWLTGAAVSLIVALLLLRRAMPLGEWSTDFSWLARNWRLAAGHHWLNVSMIGPNYVFPVLVAAIVGPAENAKFAMALLVIGFVNIIPVHFSTALFALRYGDEESLRTECRLSLRICFAVAVMSGIFFLFSSHLILQQFGPSYTSATHAMQILSFSTFPLAIKAHYVAIARVKGRMSQAAGRSTLTAAVTVAATVVGGLLGGLNGVAVAILASNCLEAALFGPTVVGVIRKPARIPGHPAEAIGGANEG
jgi:O-antigen/teichoic acid export membrane protein